MTANRLKQYLLSGVSFAIPFVASGGILIAVSIAFAPMTAAGPDFSHAPFLKLINDIGSAAFAFLIPVLSGYIAFGIADRPGLVPGFVGGYIAGQVGAGFLGGMISGLLAGFLVYWIKKLKPPAYLRPIMPILVIPVLSSLVVGFVMYQDHRRADPGHHDRHPALARGDEHRKPGRPRHHPRLDDRLRHGRAGQQGRLLLRRGHDPERQLRGHGRLRRRDLHPAPRARPGHAAQPEAMDRRRSGRPGWPRWPWGRSASPKGPSPSPRPIRSG